MERGSGAAGGGGVSRVRRALRRDIAPTVRPTRPPSRAASWMTSAADIVICQRRKWTVIGAAF